MKGSTRPAKGGGKSAGAVCHGPAVFRSPRKADGSPLVNGKPVTGFANSEEQSVGLSQGVPFSLEDALKANGAKFESTANFQPHAVADANLVTGQNPASSESAAGLLLKLLT